MDGFDNKDYDFDDGNEYIAGIPSEDKHFLFIEEKA
jgi:hypothetical protein